MVAAAAMFAAASCAQELENNHAPEVNGETVVYTASVDGADTKAVLDGVVSKWCGEELITLHDGTNPFTFYADAGETPVSTLRFSYTPGEGQPEFTATEVMAVYPSGDYTANISDKTVSNVVVPNSQALADNTYPATAAVAVAYSTNAELNFKNATALLKFKVAGDDVSYGCFAAEGNISGKFDVAYNEGKPVMTPAEADQWVDFYKNDGFLSEDATYYLAIAPASVLSFTMYLNGQEVKKYSSSYDFERNVILDLGTITYDAPANASTVYLKPGVWSAADAWYVAYFFSSTANKAVTMEDTDADGLFEAAVPEGDYSKVIFCRMNSAASELTWEEGNVWNQTSNLNVPFASDNKLCYVVENWDVYAWQTLEDAKYVAPEWTVAGTFNGWNATANPMELVDGYYVAKNVTGLNFTAQADPEDKSSTTGFKFVNNGNVWKGGEGQVTAGTWAWVWNDNGANIYVDGAAAETKYDIYLNPTPDAGGGIKFVVVAAGTPMPEDGVVEPGQPEVTPGETSEWALVGAFSGWADENFITTADANIVVLKNIDMEAAQGFLVRKPSTGWNDKYGAGNVNYIKADAYITTSQNGADMCLETAGTYDIYFNISTKNIYVMTAGKDYTMATEQTVSGKEPEQEEPEVTANVLYLKPNSNWTQANARFAAYFFGGTPGEKWVSMVDSDSDGIYEVNIPEGYDYGCNVIFCRMNPGTIANNWNNKWNQTADLKAPTDGKNLYTVKDGTWDKGGGTWSTK